MSLSIGLINASLPSYFHQKHGVFEACGAWLEGLAGAHGATCIAAEQIPMNAQEARATGAELSRRGVDFILLRVGCLLDMTAPDLTRDQILMWHGGGGPRYMLRGHLTWINHPMIGRGTDAGPIFGAIADSRFAHGDCTILRIAGHGTAHFAVEGMVSEGPAEGVTGCRGWVGGFSARAGPCPAEDVVTTVLEHGIEHHLVLVQDRHRAAFEELGAWSAMVRLPVIQPHQDFAEGDAR